MHPMRRVDKEVIHRSDIEDILRRGTVCRVAIHDQPYPYIVPLNYGYGSWNETPALFFHSAPEGRKIDLLRRDPRVSFVIDIDHHLVVAEQACGFTMHYASVFGTGEISIVEDLDEKRYAMGRVMAQYSEQDDWELPDRALAAVTVLVLRVTEMTGKRSPAVRTPPGAPSPPPDSTSQGPPSPPSPDAPSP